MNILLLAIIAPPIVIALMSLSAYALDKIRNE